MKFTSKIIYGLIAIFLPVSIIFASTCVDIQLPDANGSLSTEKIHGQNCLTFHQTVQPWKSHSFTPCGDAPSIGWQSSPSFPALTTAQNICFSCVSNSKIVGGGNAIQDGSGNITGYTPYVYNYARDCSPKFGAGDGYVVDGSSLFGPSMNGYSKFKSCGGGEPSGFTLTDEESASYSWDTIPPWCTAAGITSNDLEQEILGSPGIGRFASDEQIRAAIAKGLPGVKTFSVLSNQAPYMGTWMNVDMIGKWYCQDDGSGCRNAGPITLQNVSHKIESYTPNPQLTDAVNNVSATSCDATIRTVTDIARKCYYFIDPSIIATNKAKIQSYINNPASNIVYKGLNGTSSNTASDRALLSGLLGGYIPSGTSDAFGMSIHALYRASIFAGESGHTFYTLQANSCIYTPIFSSEKSYVLIDKIVPIVKIDISADSHNGGTDEKNILRQLTNFSSDETFLAGSGTIKISLADTRGDGAYDGFDIPDREKYNGISGIRQYSVTIEQITDYAGKPLTTPRSIVDVGGTINDSGDINRYNAKIEEVEHNITLEYTFPQNSEKNLTSAGEYQIHIIAIDTAGNIQNITQKFTMIPRDVTTTTLMKIVDPDSGDEYRSGAIIDPNDIVYTITGSISDGNTTWSTPNTGISARDESFANGLDDNIYVITIRDEYGNPAADRVLYGFSLVGNGIALDSVNTSSTESALRIDVGNGYRSGSQDAKTDENGNIFIRIRSYAPGKYSEEFTYIYRLWDRLGKEYGALITADVPGKDIQIGEFFHIFTALIDLYRFNRLDLGTANDLALVINTMSNVSQSKLQSTTIKNFYESVESIAPTKYFVTATGGVTRGATAPTSDQIIFTPSTYYPGTLDATYHTLTGTVQLEQFVKTEEFDTKDIGIISYPYIEVPFNESSSTITARYYLTSSRDNYGSGITFGVGQVNRIYIEGNYQIIGKNGYVSTLSSLGIVNSADFMNVMRRNVAILTRNREPNQVGDNTIIHGVKYVTGDISISGNVDWQTLIVKGGNVTFDGSSFNPDKEHRSIIVLKDDAGNGGNIFIKPSVRFIGALLFSEGSLFSVNSDGQIYEHSNSTRAGELSDQLVFFGGIYSKNTVGGALHADDGGTKYILPWNGETVSLDEAVKYDLSFLRMNNARSDPKENLSRDEFVVIRKNPLDITDPLPGWGIDM